MAEHAGSNVVTVNMQCNYSHEFPEILCPNLTDYH